MTIYSRCYLSHNLHDKNANYMSFEISGPDGHTFPYSENLILNYYVMEQFMAVLDMYLWTSDWSLLITDRGLHPTSEFHFDDKGLVYLEQMTVTAQKGSAFAFTSSCLILSSSSHILPSSTSIAFLITDAISLILSMCACISYKEKEKINTSIKG